MIKYIFIHGACQGSWCWYKLKKLLTAANIDYEAPDLPGHGNDTTPIPEITINTYVDAIRALIKKSDKQVVLVGHYLKTYNQSQNTT